MTGLDAWSRFVDREYLVNVRSLSIFRALFAVVALSMVPPRFSWISQTPGSLLNPPPGLTYVFFTSVPPSWFFAALDTGIVVGLIYLLAGRHVVAASLAVTTCLLVGNTWAYSFGKIDHDILLVLTPLFLAFAGWDGRPRVRGWVLSLFALTIALAMFTAALQKAFTGWLDPSSSATLGHLVRSTIVLEKGGLPQSTLVALAAMPPFGWELLDYATVLLEGAFLVAFFNRRAFLIVCAVACVFHLGTAVMMRLVFAFNLLAYAAFVDWEHVVASFHLSPGISRAQAWLSRRTNVELLAAGVAFSAVALSWANPVNWIVHLLIAGGTASVIIWVAALGVLMRSAAQLRSLWRSRSAVSGRSARPV